MKTFKQYLLENAGKFGPVYHGGFWNGKTPIKTNQKGALGVGAYFSPDLEIAKSYAKESGVNFITESYLEINNPLKIYSKLPWDSHPCVDTLVLLGVDRSKATKTVENAEEKYGYIGKQIMLRAISLGYDSLFQYKNNQLSEIVVWSANKVIFSKIMQFSAE